MLPVPVSVVISSGSLLSSSSAALSTTVNASGVSKIASSSTSITMSAVVSPARMVTVPLVTPVKSVPAAAPPSTVL
ncbi:hypothetical protein D3C83_122540 [compost metagenome]